MGTNLSKKLTLKEIQTFIHLVSPHQTNKKQRFRTTMS